MRWGLLLLTDCGGRADRHGPGKKTWQWDDIGRWSGVLLLAVLLQHLSMSVPMCTCENGRRSLWDVRCSWPPIQTTVYWNPKPCRFVDIDQNLRKVCCFQLKRRERKINEIKDERNRMKKRTEKSFLLRRRNKEKQDKFYFFHLILSTSALMNSRIPLNSDYQNFCSRRSISKFLGLTTRSLSIKR